MRTPHVTPALPGALIALLADCVAPGARSSTPLSSHTVNIPTEPPQVGCWWNPWYGYICQDFQDTKNVDGFAYQVGAGLRYRLNETFSLTGTYQMSWLDFPKADGTPSFDGLQLIVNWGF